MIQYGLISKVDSVTIEKTIDLILKEFPSDEFICTTEVGIFDGNTSRGIHEYIELKNRGNWHIAIDNNKDKQVTIPFLQCNFIIGNSNEVYNQISDNSQHFIFIDGCHAFPMVVSDFFCYESKVKEGGYLAFHDTGFHIAPYKDYQRMGDEKDLDMYISVRKALNRIGLLSGSFKGWQKVFDEQDIEDTAGGIIVFKKLINL